MSMRNEVANVVSDNASSGIPLKTFEDHYRFAEMMAKSDLVAKNLRGKPAQVMVHMETCRRLGLSSHAVIHDIQGTPTLGTDAMLALVQSSSNFESIEETIDGSVATCKLKRKGSPMAVRQFSYEDAVRAGLSNSPTWKKYPKRMLQIRARSWACRDMFADVLNGLQCKEEAEDHHYRSSEINSKDEELNKLRKALSNKQEAVSVEAEYTKIDDSLDVNQYCDRIKDCDDMEQLKTVFSEVWKEAKDQGLLSTEMEIISREKDEVKVYLQNKSISQAASDDKEAIIN